MKVAKERLDVLLVERGLAESRTRAQALILAGQVVVDEQRVDKPGVRVPLNVALRLKGEFLPYVSRGGLKLKAALEAFSIGVQNKVCADIGASTGGFTDCLLQSGALRVHAIDVGYAQLHDKLRRDPRVISKERVNARYLTKEHLPESVEVVTMDLSFISLELVIASVLPFLLPHGILIALMKPQFEAGPEHIEKGGVVRDERVRQGVFHRIHAHMENLGLEVMGQVDSPIEGPAGNREALLAARKPLFMVPLAQ